MEKITLSIAETCEALNVSRPTVTAWIKRKENPLPCIRTAKVFRIPRAALETWILQEAERNAAAR